MHRLLTTYGVNVDVCLPWLRQWYLRYQLPDGGLNCDEAVYIKDNPKSSVVSSLPPLEAVLGYGVTNLAKEELDFLDRGALYLIKRKLCLSLSSGLIIDNSWLQLTFPRFYEYDILLALTFIFNWSIERRKVFSTDSIIEAVVHIDRQFPDGDLVIRRSIWAGRTTRFLTNGSRSWSKSLASGFPLLAAMSVVGAPSPYLSRLWQDLKEKMTLALSLGLLVD